MHAGMRYRVAAGWDHAQQLQCRLPHLSHVQGRRAGLDLGWLNLLLLHGAPYALRTVSMWSVSSDLPSEHSSR